MLNNCTIRLGDDSTVLVPEVAAYGDLSGGVVLGVKHHAPAGVDASDVLGDESAVVPAGSGVVGFRVYEGTVVMELALG